MQAVNALDARRLTSLGIGSHWGDLQCLHTVGALQSFCLDGWILGFPLEPLAAVKALTGLTALELSNNGEPSEIVPLSDYFTGLTDLRKLKVDGMLDPSQSLLQPFALLVRCLSSNLTHIQLRMTSPWLSLLMNGLSCMVLQRQGLGYSAYSDV